jgi:hypothetical protein
MPRTSGLMATSGGSATALGDLLRSVPTVVLAGSISPNCGDSLSWWVLFPKNGSEGQLRWLMTPCTQQESHGT